MGKLKRVDKAIRINKKNGIYRLAEYSLYSGKLLKILYTFDNTYNFGDRQAFLEGYESNYYKRGSYNEI